MGAGSRVGVALPAGSGAKAIVEAVSGLQQPLRFLPREGFFEKTPSVRQSRITNVSLKGALLNRRI